MLDRLLKLEEQMARAEAVLLVVFVGLMLGLATYNVLYRNILVPIQVDLLTEEAEAPSEQEAAGKAAPADDDQAGSDSTEGGGDDGAGGFGGGFGAADEEGDGAGGFGGGFDEEPSTEGEDDPAAGFGGGFDDEPAEQPAEEPGGDDAEEPTDDGAAGFAGGFGDSEPSDDGAEAADDPAAGFGGGFGDADEATEPAEDTAGLTTSNVETLEAKEEPWLARFIDAIKLEWIDQVLRQLVLVVGFLGAMLATRRRKHITIDALSKLLSEKQLHWAHVVTNTVSIIVCLLLTKAGRDLVNISLEFPKEIVPWADEWVFQLVFPVGFGLLAVHFTIRLIETIYYALGKAEPRPMAEGGEL